MTAPAPSLVLTDSWIGAQKSPKDSGEKTGQFHSLGSRQHPGGFVEEVAVPAVGPPSQRFDDGQSHKYLVCK